MKMYSNDEQFKNIFATAIGEQPDSEVVQELFATYGVSRELMNISSDQLLKIKGIGPSKAKRIKSAIGLVSMNLLYSADRFLIRGSDQACELFEDLRHLEREEFHVATLDVKGYVIDRKSIFKGTLNSSIVHPREVFRYAMSKNAGRILVAHNHPSGDPTPSPEDIEVTKRLTEAGNYIGIELLDHIIVGGERSISLRDYGSF